MDKLTPLDGLFVSQKKEWGEILTGFEQKNKYAIIDPSGNQLYFAAEDGGSIIGRLFLKALRPFQMIYSVRDPHGKEIFKLFGPFFKPWTFKIMQNENEVGVITKKWSGFLKEGFTDADNFGMSFPREWSKEIKALFLGAIFLIDFVHFENRN